MTSPAGGGEEHPDLPSSSSSSRLSIEEEEFYSMSVPVVGGSYATNLLNLDKLKGNVVLASTITAQ
jgi:hypothetical protein